MEKTSNILIKFYYKKYYKIIFEFYFSFLFLFLFYLIFVKTLPNRTNILWGNKSNIVTQVAVQDPFIPFLGSKFQPNFKFSTTL